MKKERWADVPGYEGIYRVSSKGRVRSVTREVVTTTGALRIFNGVVLSPSFVRGYPVVTLNRAGSKPVQKYVHRLVAAAFVPNPEGHDVVMHRDDNPANAHWKNLVWGTYQDNTNDMIRKGRQNFGQGWKATAKLSASDVREIRKLLARGVMGKDVAEQFAVSKMTISLIKNGKSWQEVKS
ncbi:NUMOD4 domain-containing protein [Burkholderia gladioli]|uniref:NUMOD4 domain-containing protein n=1 Tax=Burkholderia gladioli TaxID=28095 RepID=UPI003D2368D1